MAFPHNLIGVYVLSAPGLERPHSPPAHNNFLLTLPPSIVLFALFIVTPNGFLQGA